MKCLYHGSDLDGHCSGALIKLRHPECEMYPFEYGDDPPWDDFVDGERVYIVDASFSGPEMEELSRIVDLVWIDHHKTAIEDVNSVPELKKNLKGLRDTNYAACELVYRFLYPDGDMPLVVQLLGRYDVWDHVDERVLPFQYGMRLLDLDPGNPLGIQVWADLLEHDNKLDKIINHGRAIMLYQFKLNADLAKGLSFELNWEGLRWICANIPSALGGSKILESVYNRDRHDAMMLFQLNKDKQWLFSLRSMKDNIDVGEIAKMYGGGGHKSAAGFARDIPPFKI